MNWTQQPPILVNIIIFCYDSEIHTGNDSERKQHFLKHKGNHNNFKEAYIDGSKSTGRKVSFAAVFANTTRRGILQEEAFIHTAVMTAIKIAMREIKKREKT